MKILQRSHVLLLLILSLAVILRLSYVLFFGKTLSLQTSGYDDYAVHIANGEGYTRYADLHPDSDLPPLYVFFLAGIYRTLGRSPVTVALVQIGLEIITLFAIYQIGRRIGGKPVGLIAAALTAFYPYLLFQDLTVNDTALFLSLLALIVWAVYCTIDLVQRNTKWLWLLTIGLLLGLAALTKLVVALLMPFIALWWWRQVGLRRAILYTLLVISIFILVLLPWIIRNTQLQGTLTLVSTNDGSNLYQGNNFCTIDYLQAGYDVQWIGKCLNLPPSNLSEIQQANWMRDQAINYLRQNVAQWPQLFALKFVTLWSPEITPHSVPPDANLANDAVLQFETPLFKVARLIHLIYFTPLLILGVVGVVLGWRKKLLIGPLISVLLAITLAYLVYHPSTRYRSPADPFLFILSAIAIALMFHPLFSRFSRDREKGSYQKNSSRSKELRLAIRRYNRHISTANLIFKQRD